MAMLLFVLIIVPCLGMIVWVLSREVSRWWGHRGVEDKFS